MIRIPTRFLISIALVIVITLPLAPACLSQVFYTTPGSYYQQNFNTLANSGSSVTWQNGLTLDGGWSLFHRTSASVASPIPVTSYATGDGSSAIGSFYSYGVTSGSDRALGGLGTGGAYFGSPASGATAGRITLAVQNKTTSPLTEFTLSYAGEQWRNNGAASPQTMRFEYGLGTAFNTVPNWIAPGSAFDFTSLNNSTLAARVNGNTTGLSPDHGGSIGNLTWERDQTLWLRWTELNDVGNDHGLAIDDIQFSASSVPEPSEYAAIAGVALVGFALWRRRFRIKAHPLDF